ncbi:MAG: hypothetical protein AB7Q01_14960, partial [Gammaproteobacteria bacterium]
MSSPVWASYEILLPSTGVYLPRGRAECVPKDVASRRIGSINAVYFEIEIGIVTLRADAKERLASTTAGDVEFAMEI